MKHKWEALSVIGVFVCVFGFVGFDRYNERQIIESCVSAGSSWTDIDEGFGTTMGCVAK